MLHIIANPASQSGSGKQKIQELVRLLKKNNMEAVLHLTTHPGHGGEIASTLKLKDTDRLILTGGDGSMDDLINGLELPYKTPVLLLPAGSGNDFARGMKLSREPADLVSVLKRDQSQDTLNDKLTQSVDLGEVTSTGEGQFRDGHRFAVSCGFGMDAAICVALEAGKLKSICNHLHIGKLSYLITGICVLLKTGKKRRATLQITYSNGENAAPIHLDLPGCAFISVHNLPYEGGGFPFAPGAIPTDGCLDVCVVSVKNRLLMIPILIANLLGARHGLFRKNVKLFRCRSITVTSDRPLPLHTDGEVIENQTGFTARALEGVLTFLPTQK